MASIMPKGLYQLLLKGLYFLIDANLMVINQYCATKIFLTGTGLKPCVSLLGMLTLFTIPTF